MIKNSIELGKSRSNHWVCEMKIYSYSHDFVIKIRSESFSQCF
jgi:hypothetical protein